MRRRLLGGDCDHGCLLGSTNGVCVGLEWVRACVKEGVMLLSRLLLPRLLLLLLLCTQMGVWLTEDGRALGLEGPFASLLGCRVAL